MPVCVLVQVNLMQYMKLSTSRDFRINAATLEEALQEQEDSQEVSAVSFCDQVRSVFPYTVTVQLDFFEQIVQMHLFYIEML